MKLLKDILYKVTIESTKGTTTVGVNNIEFNSKKITLNDVFVAIKGTVTDGHNYIDKAIANGAVAVVCEKFPKTIVNGVSYIQVANSNKALAHLAANYYNNPSKKINVIGITGTNGKTTIATLLYNLFKKAGYKVGLLSTVKIMIDTTEYKATHTTPDSLTINKYLDEMSKQGCDYCFMEVSSHGIHQNRIEGIEFRGGIFTNLSHDHLDYHSTFLEYRDVKKSFFNQLSKEAFAITNVDDKNGEVMLQNTKAKKITYAVKNYADYKIKILENQLTGLVLKINNKEVYTRLVGTFNAYNLLAIYTTAITLGLQEDETLQILSELESVSGRFQCVISNKKITAIVDYAHTPDALKNVLNTINTIRTKNEKVITVVGCGGDRDTAKRPIMGQIASEYSTHVIFTADNPRTENPTTIIEAMETGVAPQNYKKTIAIVNRKQAIKQACQIAEENDIILIAGKGHETYQEINGNRTDFNDLEIVKETLDKLDK